MTNEELDKLEAAKKRMPERIWAWFASDGYLTARHEAFNMSPSDVEYIRADLVPAQRQAPVDGAAALDVLSSVLAWAEVGVQSAPRGKTIPDLNWCGKTIRAALTNSVPGDVVREAMAAMMTAQDIFLHYGDLHQAKGTDEGNEKAFVNREHAAALGKVIRELKPWVKGGEK